MKIDISKPSSDFYKEVLEARFKSPVTITMNHINSIAKSDYIADMFWGLFKISGITYRYDDLLGDTEVIVENSSDEVTE